MNHIQNDCGEWVTAIGAENSLARLEVKWPRLIKDVRQLAEWSKEGYKDDIQSEFFCFERYLYTNKITMPQWELDLFEEYFNN